MDKEKAIEYLSSMLGKQLRVYTTDTRMFLGEFKCTDNVRMSIPKALVGALRCYRNGILSFPERSNIVRHQVKRWRLSLPTPDLPIRKPR